MLTLRFEDFEDKEDQKSVYYYANKKNKIKKFTISNDLCKKVIEFKEMKINQDIYNEKFIYYSNWQVN